MGSEPERGQEMVGYLLGTLSPETQTAVEERYFSDEGYYQELLATADELIHAYLAGGLSDPERKRFESHFLASPWRRERLDFIRDMLTAAQHATGASPAASRPPSTDWVRWGVAAALLLAAAALVAVLLRGSRGKIREVETSPAPLPSPTATVANDGSPPASPASPVHTVRVPRGSAGPVDVALAPTARSLRLEVEVEGGRLGYDAVVKRRGRIAWSAQDLPRTHPEGTVHLNIPTHLLADGDYVVSVEGEASRDPSPPPRRVVTLRIVIVRERPR
jgi:putative zinc finger protein